MNITTAQTDQGTTLYQAGQVVGWLRIGGCRNAACRAQIQAGRHIHAIPRTGVLPAYHFATQNEAINAIASR